MKRQFLLVITSIFIIATTMLQADSNPTMSRVYGNQFTPQVADSQSAGTIGALDTTFGTSGSLSVNGALSGGQAVEIQALPNGSFLVVVAKSGSASVVAQYNAQGTIASSATYGTSGIASLGTVGATVTPRATMFDAQARLLVAGGAASGTAGWIARLSTDGDTLTTFTTGTAWQFIGDIAQQSGVSAAANAGKIVAVGFNGTNAQIGRYTIAGALDTTFGTSGFTVLDGSGTLPTVATQGLVSVVVDSSDRIYVAFVATVTANSFTNGSAYIARFTAAGALDTSWNTTGFAALADLNSATSGLYVAKNNDGNFIVAGQLASNNIKVTGVTSAGGSIGGFTTFSARSLAGYTTDVFVITNLITTSDNSIFIVGSDTTTINMAVIRLIGSSGLIDTAFNTTGYNFFNISAPDTTSQIQAAAVAPNGQIYTAGYQVNSATTVPYVSRLYNTQYVSQVAQFPAAIEQGILDQTFGTVASETYAGVVTPFNGLYGSSLMQRAQSAIEVMTTSGVAAGVPPVGDILIGMNGFTNSSASSNMMFAWLTVAGAIDTTINSSGYLTLANSLTNEYLTSILQGPAGLVYVAGYASATVDGASTGALLRAYSTASTSTWTSGVAAWSVSQATANYEGVAVGYQSLYTRTLLFVKESATAGHITAYDSSGVLDTAFGAASSGTISATSYSLNMGPCYGGLITTGDNLVIAYKKTDNTVRAAAFNPNGTALLSSFGSSGVSAALFAGATTIASDNIRMCFNKNNDIVIAAINGAGTSLLVTLLDGETGVVDTSFGTAGVLTIAITGSTALQLKQIIGISDGTTLATLYDNATDDTMYLARITLAGALDTTFNSQGSQPGVLAMQIGDQVANYNSRILTTGLVQSTAGANQGNIVVAGYESVTSSDATPMVMRSYGNAASTEISYYPVTNTGVPGTLETAFNENALLGASAAKVVFVYPSGNTYQGNMLVGYDNGITSKIARIDITANTLDTTFGTAGIYTILTNLPGITTISIDAQNNILVGGTTGGAGWAQQLSPTGASPVSFTLPVALLSVNQILQQKSGRYLVAGVTASKSAVVAFQDKVISPATTFVVDLTFNPLAATSAPVGSFYLGTTATGVYSMAINTDDTILAAYKNATPVLAVAKITANGSGLATFGTSGTLLTTINPDSSAVCRVAIDSANKVVVAASSGTGVNLKIQRFLAAGTTDTTWNTDGSALTITNVGSAGVTLADLMETTTQQTVVTGYNTADGNGRLFAARLSSAGVLDSTWNPSATGTDTAGVLTFATNSAATINDSAITIDGTIVSVGQQTGGTAGDPIVMYVYGDTYITQVANNPLEASAGTLDSTIPGNSSGSWALASTLTGVPQRMYMYNATNGTATPNAADAYGAMLIASTDNASVYITKLNADLSLATFGTSGVVTITPPGSPSAITITDIFVANGANDTAQPIYVTGYTDLAPFAYSIAKDGLSSTVAAPVSSLTTTGCIRQSSNSRILVSGYTGSLGKIVAYNSAMTAIDTSFGNSSGTGYYSTAIDNPIVAMTTDKQDRIYIAYLNAAATAINVDCLLENGTALDTSFDTDGRVTITQSSLSSTQIKLAIDLTNNQLIVAAASTGAANIIYVYRFNLSNGAAAGNISTITLGGTSVLNLKDLFIDNNTTVGGLYPNIYVAGYVSAGTGSGNSVVARVASSSSSVIALDATYGTAGIANLAIGAMTVVTGAALDPDRRVYMVGSNGTTNGYMGRFFGDYYWNEKYPTVATTGVVKAVVGVIDTTLYPNNTGGIDLSSQTGWSSLASGYKARAIIENPNGDGSSLIAFGDDTNLIVGKVDADMNPVTAFSADGLTTALAMATVNNIMVDSAGNVIVAGTNAGAQKIVSFTSVGVLNATFNAAPVASTVGTVVGQQKSGRYIVGGYTGSFGIVSAYQNQSAISGAALPVDSTFGASALSGYYLTSVASQIDDLVIDSNDYIYIVYRNSGVINVAKLTPEGALVTSANTPSAQVWSTNPVTATGITATQPARIAINGAGNLLIGASTAAPDVKVALLSGALGTISVAAFAVYATATPVLTKLVGSSTSQNEFYGSMYSSAPAAIVFAVTAAGALDSAGFNSLGYNVTGVQSSVQVSGLSIQPDGKVVMVGYKSGPNPVLLRFYGYPYMPQYAQSPNLIAAGILDTTLWPTTGALDLDDYTPISTTITTLNGSSIARIYEYSNGKALVLFSGTNGGADCVLARVNKDLTLDTSFNSANGFVTITGKTNATSLFVDSDGNVYVAGGTATSWIRAYSSVGAALSGWSSATALSAGAFQVGVQSNDRVILCGKNTNGTLYGYNTSGVLDSSFGASGIVDMGTTAAINGFAIDQYDNIITVKTAAGSTVVQKVSASGLTTTASTATAISSATGNAKVVLDTAGSIVVASATINGFTLARYNNVNGNASPTNNGSQLSFSIGGSSSSVLGNIYATSDGNITLIGYEAASNKVIIGRFVSSPSGVSNANIIVDPAFNAAATTGVIGIMQTVINSAAFLALDGFIGADDRIMIAGSQASDPYLARVFGDAYVSYTSQGRTQGVAGVINTTFGSATPTTGLYDVSTLNALLTGAQGKAIFPLSNGGYYMAFDTANTAASSILVKTFANGALDTGYNTGGSVPGIAGTETASYAPLGVNNILQDGSSKVVLVGTTGGAGWMRRYTSAGVKDTAFGTAGAVAPGTSANVVVEQTPARLVVAGGNGSGGALFAYTSINPSGTAGSVDTTFNSVGTNAATGGTTPGIFLTNTTNTVYALVSDQYDRLIYAVLNDANNAVDLYRLTPSGQHDASFGTAGKVTAAIATASNAPSSVRVALDAAGNIIVAANSSTANTFSVRAFDNLSAASGNGAAIYAQINNASLTGPSVTGIATSSDGYALVLGTQSGTGAAWIARITAGGALDTSAFNPAAIGGVAGIFQYSAGGGSTAHVYNGLAVNQNGTLGMVGYENSGGVFTPTLVAVYDAPYTSQQSQSPDSKSVGTADLTLGLAGTTGITFYGSGTLASYGQVARSLALYDNNNIVVAIDGGNASSANSSIFINMFDNDGVLNTNFNTTGQATVLQGATTPVSPNFQNQYASDMITFTTAAGIRKAILAGYVNNTALGSNNSLLLQYILTPGGSGLDTANFGGFNGSPAGIAFGDGQKAFTVGQQSTGRIIVGGLSQDNLGLLLGYTAAGKLDSSFGNKGYQSTSTGSAGIYTHAIDTNNRVIIAYNNGSNAVAVARFLADGSAVDATFDASASYIATISGNSNMRVAVDSSNNAYAAAVIASGNSIMVKSYSVTDGTQINTVTKTGTQLGNASAVYTMAKLLVDAQGNVIVVAYDSNAVNVLVMRLTSSLALDTTFNGTGYITYAVAGGVGSQVATDAMIHPDGRIIIVGSEV